MTIDRCPGEQVLTGLKYTLRADGWDCPDKQDSPSAHDSPQAMRIDLTSYRMAAGVPGCVRSVAG